MTLRVSIIGPGRAGGALAIAARAAGHHLAAVVTGPSGAVPATVADRVVEPSRLSEIPVDLTIVAVRDDDIAGVASRLAQLRPPTDATVHLSGFTSVTALGDGLGATGSFHPLQTLPAPEAGARALAGSHVAVTTRSERLRNLLFELATDLGMKAFELSDERKPAYHAAAAAAANHVVEALAVAEDLFRAASVDPVVAQPLTRRVVDNVFEMGALASLTGPVARGDIGTVRGHLASADAIGAGREFRLLTEALALRAGQPEIASEARSSR